MLKERIANTAKMLKYYLKHINWTKRKQIALIILIISVFFFIFLLSRGNSGDAATFTVQSQKYEEKIVAVGQLQLAKETTLISEVSGEILTIGAEEGDIISADSIIISINDSDQNFQLEQKKASYVNAEASYQYLVDFDYASAKQELVSQTSKKEQTQKSYESAGSLYQEGALSQIDFLEYKSDYEAALAAWNTARLKVQSLEEGGSLRSSAGAQLQSAKTSYEGALNDQKKYQITVPWNSVLLKTYVSEHDYIQPGEPLAEIGQAGSYHVITELDEKYFPYLEKGMKAMISLGDSGNRNGAEGIVDVISPKINNETGTFEVTIAIPAEFRYQASDLTVNVEIMVIEKKNAIVIPEDYLIEGDSYVYLYQNGKAVKAEVKYENGLSSKLLITEGLKDGDIIIMPDAPIQDGNTVKINKGDGAS